MRFTIIHVDASPDEIASVSGQLLAAITQGRVDFGDCQELLA